jgi:hypothetical protein
MTLKTSNPLITALSTGGARVSYGVQLVGQFGSRDRHRRQNRSLAARLLGVSRSTRSAKLEEHGLL